LWNTIPTRNLFVDARLGYKHDSVPDLSCRKRTIADRQRDQHHHWELHGEHRAASAAASGECDRASTTWNQALGGRHEFKFGFDQTHAAGKVETTRFDDLTANWNSQTGLAQTVTLYATPFETATTLDVTSLFLQDSYSMKRFTVTAGIRYEHLHAYLPDQSSPATRWTALGIPAFQNVPRTLSQTDVITGTPQVHG